MSFALNSDHADAIETIARQSRSDSELLHAIRTHVGPFEHWPRAQLRRFLVGSNGAKDVNTVFTARHGSLKLQYRDWMALVPFLVGNGCPPDLIVTWFTSRSHGPMISLQQRRELANVFKKWVESMPHPVKSTGEPWTFEKVANCHYTDRPNTQAEVRHRDELRCFTSGCEWPSKPGRFQGKWCALCVRAAWVGKGAVHFWQYEKLPLTLVCDMPMWNKAIDMLDPQCTVLFQRSAKRAKFERSDQLNLEQRFDMYGNELDFW